VFEPNQRHLKTEIITSKLNGLKSFVRPAELPGKYNAHMLVVEEEPSYK